ncbi:hypothetical protein PG996_004847 [Apiospora saccharicola]|uniref:Uncharacterized protein n=1 Tax=Apiospora saccharicola TaxID=335842 RepID=A0ABR1W5B0_9PEZI
MRAPVVGQILVSETPVCIRKLLGRQVGLAVRVEVPVGAADEDGDLADGVVHVRQGGVEPVHLVKGDAERGVLLAQREQPVLFFNQPHEVAALQIEHREGLLPRGRERGAVGPVLQPAVQSDVRHGRDSVDGSGGRVQVHSQGTQEVAFGA